MARGRAYGPSSSIGMRRRIEELNMGLTVAGVLPRRALLRVPDIGRSLLLVRSIPNEIPVSYPACP